MLKGGVAAGWPVRTREVFCFSLPVFAIFALSIFFPSTRQVIKIPFFGLAVASSLFFLLLDGGRLRLHRYTVLWTLFYVAVGLFWVDVGLVRHAPGALAVATVYVVWPLVYLLFINLLDSEVQFRRLAQVFLWAMTLGVAADIGFLLESFSVIPGSFFNFIGSGNAFGLRVGSPSYSSTRVANFLFLVPMCMTIILHRWPKGRGGGMLLYSWSMVLAGLVMIVLSQRRSVYIVTGLSPFMALAVDLLMKPRPGPLRSRTLPFVIAGAAALLLILGMWWMGYFDYIDWNRIFERFHQGFDFSGQVVSADRDANARAFETQSLLDGWRENPLLGGGHGAAAGVLRSGESPWSYELTYLALLFQTGILGFALYALGVCWIVFMLVTIIRDTTSPFRLYAAATLNGMAGFLLGSATDPYLLSFDYLWVLFMPVAMVNFELMRRDRRTRNSATILTNLPAGLHIPAMPVLPRSQS